MSQLMRIMMAAEATTAAGEPVEVPWYSSLITLALPIGLIVLMWALMIRPQRKQEKKQQEERKSITVGDTVVTIGGMTGKVVNIKDDDITISTSVAQTLVTYRRDAINSVKKPISDD